MTEMTLMPSRWFLAWSLRALFKACLVGAVLGILWTLTTFWSVTYDGAQVGGRTLLMVSFIVDGSLGFGVAALAYTAGIAVSTWDIVGYTVREGRALLGRNYLYGLVISLTVVIAARSFLGVGEQTVLALEVVTLTVCSAAGIAGAHRAYLLHTVMTREERSSYARALEGRHWTLRAADRILPWLPGRDRSRLPFSLLLAFAAVTVALTGALNLAPTLGSAALIPLLYALGAGTLLGGLGLAIRLWDTYRPWGTPENLYPKGERERVRTVSVISEEVSDGELRRGKGKTELAPER